MNTGIVTGLMGYSLKKEMLGEGLFYRELQTFNYELYSLDLTGHSPVTIHNNILNEFRTKYSGDINVKVFSVPADYLFPNDSIRAAKYNVEVQVKSVPNIGIWQSELGTAYYSGLSSGFFATSGAQLLDLKESFDFGVGENGTQTFNHGLSFGLLSGTKTMAINVASGIFSKDKDTTFGISTMVNGVATIANSSLYQNYYSESYDTIRNSYAFSRKREIFPTGVANYVYNMTHVFDLKEDGLIEITEKCNVKGKRNFSQAQVGIETLISTSYNRCNSFYSTYSIPSNNFSTPITSTLVTAPIKIIRALNRPFMAADYEVSYTNNPQFFSDYTAIEETLELSDLEIGVIDLKHNLVFTRNKRVSTTEFADMITTAVNGSSAAANYYFNTYYPSPLWGLHLIKKEVAWPNRKNKGARASLQYNNHPRYYRTVNGVTYSTLESKILHTKPADILTEYKVINRPTKLSVINYAYQTEKGQITVILDAGLDRDPDEFVVALRSNVKNSLTNLYSYACSLFFQEFSGTIPLAFTYYMSDVKYAYNSETGGVQLTVVFTYTIKKYIL